MTHIDSTYLDIAERILTGGSKLPERTGTGTLGLFGLNYQVDLRDGFPILTTKKVNFKAVVQELLWFLSGSSDVNKLGNGIWSAWAPDKDDNQGRRQLKYSYGAHWRAFPRVLDYVGLYPETEDLHDYRPQYECYTSENVDQISWVINELKTNPFSRRMVVSAWEPGAVYEIGLKEGLPPCHYTFALGVTLDKEDNKVLNLHLTQRSGDWFLGIPFNLSSYSLLLSMFAQEVGMIPGIFSHSIVNAHIYENHVEQVQLQLWRRHNYYALPKLVLADKPMLEMKLEDIQLLNYQHHPAIKAPIAV
jgi:thymidylate synthase